MSSDMPEPSHLKRRKSVPGRTVPKVGMAKNLDPNLMKRIFDRKYERRRLLAIPQELLNANPDKHFCFVNANKLEKNGYWHEKGYEVFKADTLPENIVNKFNKSPDGFIRRNEMVLAWIPKEEHEMRVLEAQIIRGNKDMADVFYNNDILRSMQVHAKKTETLVTDPTQEG